jgi:hypothetical protein
MSKPGNRNTGEDEQMRKNKEDSRLKVVGQSKKAPEKMSIRKTAADHDTAMNVDKEDGRAKVRVKDINKNVFIDMLYIGEEEREERKQ